MPIICFCSPKGGAGKSTSALILATQLARETKVSLIDADPNHPLKNWAEGGNVPPNLTIISDVKEDTITDIIEDAATKDPFVIVDLEGSASKLVFFAVGLASFVIVPTQGSQLDAEQADKAFAVIREHEKLAKRHNPDPDYKLPYSVLLTRTNSAIRTRTLRYVQEGLIDAGKPVFKNELNEREAFRAMFSYRQPLEKLNTSDVPNLDKAIINAELYTKEVIEALKTLKKGR
jgi:chromosome partitioning protein